MHQTTKTGGIASDKNRQQTTNNNSLQELKTTHAKLMYARMRAPSQI